MSEYAIDITCPTCGAIVAATGWDHGHRRATCTECRDDLTIVVHRTYSSTIQCNRNAPFYPLVELIDSLSATHQPRNKKVA